MSRRRPASLVETRPHNYFSQAGAARRVAAARLLAPSRPSDLLHRGWLRDLSLFAPAFEAPQQVQAAPLVCKLLTLCFHPFLLLTGYILHEGGQG